MSAFIQLVAGTCETALIYSLVACGFYFASTATRHFCFVAAVPFVIVPLGVSLCSDGPVRVLGAFASFGACALLALLYKNLSATLSSHGAREGQLLILSLAGMTAIENVITALYGSASRTLWLPQGPTFTSGISMQQIAVILLALASVGAIVTVWHRALFGKVMRALVESRLNLSLRGFPVPTIEAFAAVVGFLCIGLGGLFWALDGRIKPSMTTEVAIIGAVTLIVSTMIDVGLLGLIATAVTLAVVRTFLSLTLEGDWSMTAMLVLLCIAAIASRRRLRGVGAL